MKISSKALFLIFGLLFTCGTSVAQSTSERVYLVWLEVQRPSDVAHCYTERYDRQRVALDITYQDPLSDLADYSFAEDEMEGPDCFLPELKLIYKNYTYIVSLYCTKMIKYQNASPYTPSNRRIRSDVLVTESIYEYLNDLRVEHFGRQTLASGLLQQVTTGEPLESLTEDDIDLNLLMDEEGDPLEAELENEARETPIILEEEEWDDD